MSNFLDLADYQREQVIELLMLAERLAQKPEPQALAGKILGLLFFNPSLRTLASFQAAMARLGGNSFVIAAGHRARMAWAVGVLFLCGGLAASFMIPAPPWVIALDLLAAYLPTAWIAIQIGRRMVGGGLDAVPRRQA